MAGQLPRRFSRNVGSNYAVTAASIVVAVVMTPVLVHGLGVLEYGVWVLVGSLVWYLPLLEFGFGAATVKYVAEFEARGEHDRVRRTVATSFWTLCIPAILALAVAAGIAAAFPLLFDLQPRVEHAAQLLVLLVAFDLALAMPMDTFGNVLVGLQRYDLLNATLVAVLLAQALAWAIVLEAGGGLVALGIVTVALSLAGQAARFVIARHVSADASIAPRFFDRALIGPLASLSAWFSLATISRVVIQRVDVLVVGLVVGVRAAAVYAVGQKLALLADQAILPLTRTFFPHSSEVSARSSTEELGPTVYAGTRVALLVAGPLCVALALLATPAIDAWVGPGFEEASLVVVFLALAGLARALTQVGTQTLLGVGKAKVPAVISAGEAVTNLALSIVLASTMGLEGVALATLLAAALAHVGVLLPYTCRSFGLSLPSFVGTLAKAHAPAAAAAVLVGVVLLRADLEGVAAVASGGAAVAAAYLAVLAYTGLDGSERRRLGGPLATRLTRAVVGRR
jgi:O-antigen/teichoic acid export membrane protein